jgi:hypothetical protein
MASSKASANAKQMEEMTKQNSESGLNQKQKTEGHKPPNKTHGQGSETIAADLTLYRGPMAALDAMHENQRVRNIQDGKKGDHHHYNKN